MTNKIMEDQLITFETAKLAKGKGFREIYLTTDYIPMYVENDYDGKGDLCEQQGEDDCRDDFFLAVSQSILHRWLREVHKIEIDVTFATITGSYKVTLWTKSDKVNGDHYVPKVRTGHIQTYNTYEQALEIGLEKALKLI